MSSGVICNTCPLFRREKVLMTHRRVMHLVALCLLPMSTTKFTVNNFSITDQQRIRLLEDYVTILNTSCKSYVLK